MKKIFLTAFTICVVLGVYSFMIWIGWDKTPPRISFEETELYYNSKMTNEELCSNVRAIDERDGDVSHSLLVEYIVENEEKNIVTVFYAARDSRNNIAKASQVIEYEEKGKSNKR